MATKAYATGQSQTRLKEVVTSSGEDSDEESGSESYSEHESETDTDDSDNGLSADKTTDKEPSGGYLHSTAASTQSSFRNFAYQQQQSHSRSQSQEHNRSLSAQVRSASATSIPASIQPRSRALQSQAALISSRASSASRASFSGAESIISSGQSAHGSYNTEYSSFNPLLSLDAIALELLTAFGFQQDVLKNTKEMLATLIQSRAASYFDTTASPTSVAALHQQQVVSSTHKRTSRQSNSALIALPPISVKLDSEPTGNLAAGLVSLHNDYIYGKNSNYRRWCLSDPIRDPGISYDVALRAWRRKFRSVRLYEKTKQMFLYFAITQESSNTRLMPELMWFLFKTATEHLETNTRTFLPEYDFLNRIVKPIYDFHADQLYAKNEKGRFVRRERDHAEIIGYDDLNELFWDSYTMDQIVLKNGTKFFDLPTANRWENLGEIDWKKSAKKTYYERRTFIIHLIVNYSRLVAFLLGTFLFFLLTLLAPVVWDHRFGPVSPYDSPYVVSQIPAMPGALRGTAFSIGGLVAIFITLVATISEKFYLPRTRRNLSITNGRVSVAGILFIICAAPIAAIGFLYFSFSGDPNGKAIIGLSVVAVILNVIGFFVASFVPLQDLSRRKIYNQEFVGRISKMTKAQRGTSIAFWTVLLIAKFLESYFVIFHPAIPALESIYAMDTRTCMNQDVVNMCMVLKWFTFAMLSTLLLVFYFLDTYVWWLLLQGVLQYGLSTFKIFKLWSWEQAFPVLPSKLLSRLVSVAEMPPVGNYRTLNAQIWNSIIDSFKEDHLISEAQHSKLSFTETFDGLDGNSVFLAASDRGRHSTESITSLLRVDSQSSLASSIVASIAMESRLGEYANRVYMDPEYLTMLRDGATKIKFFGPDSEAERRLKYLAHSLDMNFPTPAPVKKMPNFGLLIPHYAEKIIFSFEELTTLSNGASMTLLSYLRSLHRNEWDNLMEECRELLEDDEDPSNQVVLDNQSFVSAISLNNIDTNVGDSIPVQIRLQVRLWASRRQQSLYRTVSGVFKYYEALELKYRIENADELGDLEEAERNRIVKNAVKDKFKLTISMQRYAEFSEEEKDNTKLLFDLFPSITVVYPERVLQPDGTEKVFTRMIDGFCDLDLNNEYIPKLNIELPGWPILGDGKGCNQSHGIYFTRGEFLQVLDANQDHYFEECMKVGSVLKEFKVEAGDDPVGLVGVRESIFSAGIGAVADFSATTETTLVSLYQPTLHKLGMRLHYGHPDFWNLSYALPRGGVSKAQKGLHVNEDIYAGMMVMLRGGKNLHCEYTQVGKGKDLGLNSVMGYFSKLAMGMSEQVLSREQYRLGTTLSFDRLLTFYFANPGFIMSNVSAMLSMQMLTLFYVCISALSNSMTACPGWDVLGDGNFNETQVELNPPPFGCAIFSPIYDWQTRIVLTFIPVIFIILIPVMMHTALERGIMSLLRYMRQILSLNLLFSVFSTQVWARSFLNTATFGQARYIATGRSVEIARKTFASLYGNYKEMSMGIGLALVPPLFLAPFLYNPHQFRFEDFVQDYYATLQWFGFGSVRSSDPKADSWLAFHKRHRTQYTGTRIDPNDKKGTVKETRRRAWRSVIWLHEIVYPVIIALTALTIYSAGSGGGIRLGLYLAGVSAFPMLSNALMLLVIFLITLTIGPIASFAAKNNGIAPVTVGILRLWSGINLLLVMVGCWILADFTFTKSILGFLCFCMVQRLYVRFVTLCLPREVETSSSNLAWWDGRWNRVNGIRAFVGPVREFFCKMIEMTAFAMDVFQAHVILLIMFPFTWIKYLDDVQSLMVLWIPANNTKKILSDEERSKLRRRKFFGLSIFSIFILLLVVLLIPSWWVPSALRTAQMNFKHKMWSWRFGKTSCSSSITCPNNEQCVFATFPQVWNLDYGVCYPIPTAIQYQTCGGNIADPAVCESKYQCFYPTNGTSDGTGYCYLREKNGGTGDTCITSNSTNYFNSIGTLNQCESRLLCTASPNFPFVGYGYLGTCE
ncbi:hypothetical protein HK100_008843 [Physocladia obscura]|uniref:1,3-beta-glucan synthase n=1 Tax=Physocladia obscura TaxID=109957 RepID=A0AAD5T9Q0_9FUNG|nr:hypothetical protein HK100_008843 [Physocladia obscura]